jgi:hypothetical protein
MSSINKSKISTKTIPEKLDLGNRKVSKMNFSYIITLPKIFIQSTPYGEITIVKITMLEDGCLKIIPVSAKHGDDEIDLIHPTS